MLSCVPGASIELNPIYLSSALSLQEWLVCGKTRLPLFHRPARKVSSMLAVSQMSLLIFALLLACFQHITLVSYFMAL